MLATSSEPGRRSDRRDALLAGLVAVALLGLFVAVQWAELRSYDGRVAVSTARAMAEGRLHLLPEEDPTRNHFPYSHYGIGMPLVLLPLYLLQRALHIAPHLLESLASPLLLAASAALLYLTGRELGWSRRLSLAGALVFGALTQALEISQEAFSEPGVALGIGLLVLGMLRWRSGRASGPWLVGSGLGVGLLFRSDSALLLGAALVLLPAFVPWRRLLSERRAWVGLVLPVLPVLAWTAWYSLRRDGSLVPAVYGAGFTTPLPTGFYGLVLSPGKGLFAYNPFLLLAIPGAVALWRRDRAATALLVLLMVDRALFYAGWSDWAGGVSWGPRFLMPAVGPFALLAVYGVSRIPRLHLALRVPAVAAVVALAVAGGVVSVASVWVNYASSERWVIEVPAEEAARRHAYVHSFGDSAIAYNLRHLDGDVRPWTLVHFRGGPDPIGILALATAVLASLAAWALAAPGPAPPEPRARSTSHPEPTRSGAGSPTEASPAEVEAAVRPPVQLQSPWAPGGGA
jgi:4-amino-4-deoxy-L-arabinose transferase-like glycosyltransferase